MSEIEIKVYRTTPKSEALYFEQPRIPKILHTAWVGTADERSQEMCEMTRSTFMKYHDDWVHLHWDEERLATLDLSPLGVTLEEVQQLLETVPPVFKIDVYRTIIGYLYGGLYCDVDITYHANVEPMLFGRSFVTPLQQDDERLAELGFGTTGCFFACVPHGLPMKLLFDLQMTALRKGNMTTYDDHMQGVGITPWNDAIELAIKMNYPVTILPREYVIPYGYWEQDQERRFKSSVAVHHWNHSGKALERMKRACAS